MAAFISERLSFDLYESRNHRFVEYRRFVPCSRTAHAGCDEVCSRRRTDYSGGCISVYVHNDCMRSDIRFSCDYCLRYNIEDDYL